MAYRALEILHALAGIGKGLLFGLFRLFVLRQVVLHSLHIPIEEPSGSVDRNKVLLDLRLNSSPLGFQVGLVLINRLSLFPSGWLFRRDGYSKSLSRFSPLRNLNSKFRHCRWSFFLWAKVIN
mmetsp:Transcript_17407/g.26824  ORF Transcript_17407/g.26824 Transcript_17407/m.26824 type:complete len:123 (-) Transcript_17407:1221-1589(-)